VVGVFIVNEVLIKAISKPLGADGLLALAKKHAEIKH